jgi:hypothetical protein
MRPLKIGFWLCAGLLGSGSVPWSACSAAEVIGVVKAVDGGALIGRGPDRIPARIGDRVQLGDHLETDGNGALGITFKDDTRISIGPRSQLDLMEFQFTPADRHYAFVVQFLRGSLLYVSGLIGKLSPESISIQSPIGTVAVRGTRFLGRIDP